jgi:hypothetical protein
MNPPSTPKSQSERAVRARLAKRFATVYAFKNNCKMPSTEAINKHVDYEMHLSKVFSLSPGFEQDVWDLVYDEGVQGASGIDKERLDALCDEWDIPEASLACRNKVKVQLCTDQYGNSQADGLFSRQNCTTRGEHFESTASSSCTMMKESFSIVCVLIYGMPRPNTPGLLML